MYHPKDIIKVAKRTLCNKVAILSYFSLKYRMDDVITVAAVGSFNLSFQLIV